MLALRGLDKADGAWRALTGVSLEVAAGEAVLLCADEARRTGSTAFPELTRSAELHGGWFPRVTEGTLRLSELDALLLGGADASWRTTANLVGGLPQERQERLTQPFHLFVIDRLRAWATHGVLERETLEDDNPWARDRFRATDRMRALLGQGLDGVGDAPQLHVGGCLVNDPASPWVRIEDDAGWRLALHDRP